MSIIKGLKTQATTVAASYGIKKVSGILRKTLGLQDKNRQSGPLSKSSAEFNKPTNIFSYTKCIIPSVNQLGLETLRTSSPNTELV